VTKLCFIIEVADSGHVRNVAPRFCPIDRFLLHLEGAEHAVDMVLGETEGRAEVLKFTVTLIARAEKSNETLRVTCAVFEDARIILPGKLLELQYEAGQVVGTRKSTRGLSMHDPIHAAIADLIKGITRTYEQAHPGTPSKKNLMGQLEKIAEKIWREVPMVGSPT
jgi:hypothetical protein